MCDRTRQKILKSLWGWASCPPQTYNIWQQKLWQLVAIEVFSAGVLSCTLSYQAETWWNKGLARGKFIIPIAHIINQPNSPLLIADSLLGEVIPLSHRLDPKVPILRRNTFHLAQPPNGY